MGGEGGGVSWVPHECRAHISRYMAVYKFSTCKGFGSWVSEFYNCCFMRSSSSPCETPTPSELCELCYRTSARFSNNYISSDSLPPQQLWTNVTAGGRSKLRLIADPSGCGDSSRACSGHTCSVVAIAES